MPSVGAHCHELRVRDENTNWRIMYRVDDDAIVVVEVWNKTTRETPRPIIDICQRRLNAYDREDRGQMMNQQKRQRLEAKGWKVGTVAEFLNLTPEESALIEIKLALSKHLRERRVGSMTQTELAAKLRSSQSRIAKAESGHSSVSMELLVRAILATGATPHEIGEVLERV